MILDALITQWKAVTNVCSKSLIDVSEHEVPATVSSIFQVKKNGPNFHY